MGYEIQQYNSVETLNFLMVSAADHITGMPGLAPTVTISKNGGVFAAPAGAVSDFSLGWYKVAPSAVDANMAGPLVLHATAPGCDPTDTTFDVIAVGLIIPAAMAGYNYSGNPATSTLDWIRFEIQDTGPAYCGDPWRFLDNEILSKLADEAGNKWLAGADLLLIWARLLGHHPNFTIGRFSEDYNAAAKFLQEKAAELQAISAAMTGGQIGAYVGGVSVSDRAAKEADGDRTQTRFKRGMFDNADAGW